MNEDRVIIWGCTPGMVIDEKYLPPPRPVSAVPEKGLEISNGTYDLIIREEARRLPDNEYPEVIYHLIFYDGVELIFSIWYREQIIGRRVTSAAHRSGKLTGLDGKDYVNIGELLAAVTAEDA